MRLRVNILLDPEGLYIAFNFIFLLAIVSGG